MAEFTKACYHATFGFFNGKKPLAAQIMTIAAAAMVTTRRQAAGAGLAMNCHRQIRCLYAAQTTELFAQFAEDII